MTRRRRRSGALLAVLLPALSVGATVLVIADPGAPEVRDPRPPAELARKAEEGARRPLLAQGVTPGRAELGRPPPLESVGGGIRPAEPARISIPAAGVDARVNGVRARDGALQVPDLGVAGWYTGGARPGEHGRAVIIGHLDGRDRPGLFARVPRIPPGTEIDVLDRRGDSHRYNVIGGAQVEKDRFPAESVYGPADAPVLVLITCGGPFVPGRGYRDNVLVYARAA